MDTHRTQILIFNPLSPSSCQYTAQTFARIARFAKDIVKLKHPHDYTKELFGRLVLGDPRLLALIGVKDDIVVAHGVIEVRSLDGEPIAEVLQVENSDGRKETVDLMMAYADNWCKAMNVSKMRGYSAWSGRVLERWSKRFGYQVVKTIIEREVR